MQQGCIKLIRSDTKDIYNVYLFLFFFIHQSILKTKYITVSIKIWSSTTVFNIELFLEQQISIRMISEWSCDTED